MNRSLRHPSLSEMFIALLIVLLLVGVGVYSYLNTNWETIKLGDPVGILFSSSLVIIIMLIMGCFIIIYYLPSVFNCASK